MEYCTLKNKFQWKLSEERKKFDEEELVMISFNILADRLCLQQKLKKESNKYDHVSNTFLEWNFRSERMFSIFERIKSDIICLQELDSFHFENGFAEEMEKRGYGSLFQKEKKQLKKVGNAIFFNKEKLELVWFNHRSRVLIAALKLKTKKEEKEEEDNNNEQEKIICVCNVHLEGNPKLFVKRFSQMKSALEQLQRYQFDLTHLPRKKKKKTKKGKFEQTEEEIKKEMEEEQKLKEIEKKLQQKFKFLNFVAGDFNCCENSGIQYLLKNGNLETTFKDPTFNLPYTNQNYVSSFKFESSYHNVFGKEAPFTFGDLKNGFGTIDFIFYDRSTTEVLAAMNYFENTEQSHIKRKVLTEKIPSDHFPISCSFKMNK